MPGGSTIRALFIKDNRETAPGVEERLGRHGIIVQVPPRDSAADAMRRRDTYDVLCIDLTAPGVEAFDHLRAQCEAGDLPPTILITGQETAGSVAEFMGMGPVCCLVGDSEGRYLDTLPDLFERLSARERRTRETMELEKLLKKAEERFLTSQKTEAIGMLAGGIAHNFNNILATILGYASFLRGKAVPDDIFFQGLSAIEESAIRASELTAQLQAYSRGGNMENKPVSVNSVVGEIYNLIRKTFDKSIEIRLDLDEGVQTVDADISQIKQMVLNLAIGARDAMPSGGVLTFKTFMSKIPEGEIGISGEIGGDIGPGDYAGLSVSDTGAGMGREAGQRISGPSFSRGDGQWGGRPVPSVVYDIAKRHGGRVDVKSEAGTPTEFIVLLPVSRKREEAATGGLREAAGGGETILVIDDEHQIIQMLTRLLTDFGYRVLHSDSGAGGVRIFEEQGKEIDLVLLDIMMPGMGGKEVMSRVLGIRPDTKILMASGYSEPQRHRELLEMGAAGFIGKPFVLKDLLIKIRDILG